MISHSTPTAATEDHSARSTLQRHANWWAAVIIVVYALLHLYQIAAPPNGYHIWRESDTAVVAFNYYQFDLPLLQPMTNELSSMAAGLRMELPVYCWLAAAGYTLFGTTHAIPHLITILFGCLGLVCFYGTIKAWTDRLTALAAVIALAFSPLYFYYSFKIMPDMMMLGLTLCSVRLFTAFRQTNRLWILAVAATALALAACIKPFALAVLLPLLWLSLRTDGSRPRKLGWFVVFAAASILPAALWMASTGWLLARTGVVGSFLDYLFTALFFKRLVLQWPWDLFVGWALVAPFIVGLYIAIRRRVPAVILWWLLAGTVIIVLTARYSRIHDYYSLIVVPALAALAGIGLRHMWRGQWARVIAIVLVIGAPVSAFLRVADRFNTNTGFEEIRTAAETMIPADATVIVQDDTRGATRLYQLNRRGWYVASSKESDRIPAFIAQGAEYLVLAESIERFDPGLAAYVEPIPIPLGPLFGYRVKSDM